MADIWVEKDGLHTGVSNNTYQGSVPFALLLC